MEAVLPAASPAQTPTTTAAGWAPSWRLTAYAAVIAAAYALMAILRASPWSFYTLDDPYIHFALAENIARGHYGVNLEDVSNPSSSILWPLLMVGAEKAGVLLWAPLAINIAAFALSLRLALAFAASRLTAGGQSPAHALIFTGGLLFSFNLFGVIYTGMEHSLHALACIAAVTRLIDKRYDWVTLGCLIVSPLIRFEGALVLAFGVGAALVDRRYVFAALAVGVVGAAFLAYQSAMAAMGLPAMPSSVLAKSDVANASNAVSAIQALAASLTRNVYINAAPTFGLLAAAFAVAVWMARGRDRMLALGLLGFAALAFLASRADGFERYNVYSLCTLSLGAIHLFRVRLSGWLTHRVAALALAGGFVLANASIGLHVAMATPMAARNIDRQQHQMHRFIDECWRAPIAINDLGWTSFRNDQYVLDLFGLGNEAARKHRQEGGGAWMQEMADAHGVEAAAVYREWFPNIPAGWRHVGDLVLDDPAVTPASARVAFYALKPGAGPRISACLGQLAQTLPEGAHVDFGPASGK